MHEAIYLLIGGALALLIEWSISLWWRIGEKQRRNEAKKILSRHGLAPRMYLAGMGVENDELRKALAKYDGHIILDKNSVVVGRLLPEIKQAPHLRLVVSND